MATIDRRIQLLEKELAACKRRGDKIRHELQLLYLAKDLKNNAYLPASPPRKNAPAHVTPFRRRKTG